MYRVRYGSWGEEGLVVWYGSEMEGRWMGYGVVRYVCGDGDGANKVGC